jgi:hypothetical protein
MYDPSELFPEPYHPVKINLSRDFTHRVTPHNRYKYPPTYYLIDFGISRHYPNRSGPVTEQIICGLDKTVPEHEDPLKPCDPFATDVYLIGNLVRQNFIEVR